jgi:hypothetical protein
MNIRESILALLEVSYEQSSDDITRHVQKRVEGATADDVLAEIERLMCDRWLIYDRGWYRRRTQAQWDAIQASNNPSQGSLL